MKFQNHCINKEDEDMRSIHVIIQIISPLSPSFLNGSERTVKLIQPKIQPGEKSPASFLLSHALIPHSISRARSFLRSLVSAIESASERSDNQLLRSFRGEESGSQWVSSLRGNRRKRWKSTRSKSNQRALELVEEVRHHVDIYNMA